MDTIVLAPAGYLLDPDLGSDYERPWQLARGLAKHGFRVVVVAREVKREVDLGPNVVVMNPPGRLPVTPAGRLMDRANLYWHARRVAYREVAAGHTLVVHHYGPCGAQSPSLIGHLPVPLVYGPVPAPRPTGLLDDEWLSWLRTPHAGSTSAWLSRVAARQAGAIGSLLARPTFRGADAITVEGKANTPSSRPDAVVIRPGVDIDHFHPVEGNTPVEGRVIAVGSLLGRKGYDVLIRAMAQVIRQNVSAHLLLLGTGPQESSLRQTARELGIGSAVTFVGNVTRDALPAYLRSAMVFCHPARYDSFPLAPIEAMACGLPTLVSSVGALPEIVGDGGLIHSQGNAEALSSDLFQVLTAPDVRARLAANARSRVIECFTWQSMCDSYVDLYYRLRASRTKVRQEKGAGSDAHDRSAGGPGLRSVAR